MVDIKEYINESIFDEEDQLTNVEVSANIIKWFKKLTDSRDIIKSIDSFIKVLKKDKVEVHRSRNSMWYRDAYVRFEIIDKNREWQSIDRLVKIRFLLPNEHRNGWDNYVISFKYYYDSDEVQTRIEKNQWSFYSCDMDLDRQNWKVVKSISYSLPDKWKGITKLIENYGKS